MNYNSIRKLRAGIKVRLRRVVRAGRAIRGRERAAGRPEEMMHSETGQPASALTEQVGAAAAGIEHLRAELADARRANQQLASGVAELKQMIGLTSRSIMWLTRQTAHSVGETNSYELLVSVIMPTWERADVIEDAIASLLAQSYSDWECIIIDDGSTDETCQRVERYLGDPRFQYIRQDHKGVGNARNLGLARARGEVVAYLDTDNEWLPGYLSAVASSFAEDLDLECAYTGQIFNDLDTGFCHVRCEPYDPQRLYRENFIDLNAFSHRKSVYDERGGFDERFDRLGDWDLIQRYTERARTRCIPTIGGIYNHGRPDQISRTSNIGYNRYLMVSKRPRAAPSRVKVLYALWHYPQLSESYIRSEIAGVAGLGADVEVWSEEGVAAGFESDVPVHRGTLRTAIDRTGPAIVHIHWLNMAAKYRQEVRETGLPITVRGHGFEFTTELVSELARDPIIQGIYLFPHLAAKCGPPCEKIKILPAVFDASFYRPGSEKDPSLVVRAGCALPGKDYLGFLRAAQLCPGHRFILVLCHAYMKEEYLDEIAEMNRSMGSPVELLVDMQHEEVAELVGRAGIYLHTNAADASFGMPVSISEAMAAGCCIIARRCRAARDYVQDAGFYYETHEEAAALIRQTGEWNERQWREARRRSIDRAFDSFLNIRAVEPLVDQWRSLARPAY